MSETLTTVQASPWLNSVQAAGYAGRGRRFILREIKAGRLRAAVVGGRREILTRREWIDAWVEAQARPVLVRSTRMLG